ncbi:hypothetical protein WH47_03740 [Habropoda laboriosa]|uniref:Uncharacterized protein n=1 Tax=Habropoda laboriosa TaxID=597456 RepID=A0A0L7QW17_9HYME|nr:hypothetical protein WH47_03740 [Habropoda laboriosa]
MVNRHGLRTVKEVISGASLIEAKECLDVNRDQVLSQVQTAIDAILTGDLHSTEERDPSLMSSLSQTEERRREGLFALHEKISRIYVARVSSWYNEARGRRRIKVEPSTSFVPGIITSRKVIPGYERTDNFPPDRDFNGSFDDQGAEFHLSFKVRGQTLKALESGKRSEDFVGSWRNFKLLENLLAFERRFQTPLGLLGRTDEPSNHIAIFNRQHLLKSEVLAGMGRLLYFTKNSTTLTPGHHMP